MFELDNQIARLELCSEQLRIHLRSLDKGSPEADEVRSDLLIMLQKLVALKDKRFEMEGAYPPRHAEHAQHA